MKITLQQNEIELAIREHIAKTLDLPEGAKVEFDDEDGITAVIDLNPGAEAKETSSAGKTRRTYTRRQRAEGSDEPKTTGEESAAAGQHVPTQESAQEPAQSTAAAGLSLVASSEPEGQPEPSAEPADEPPAEGGERKSIFGGLKRPVNS